jgi:DNA-binding MarR family transcriptional regulator
MSRIVDALEVDGLARRRVNQQDRRALLIEATKKGAAMLKEGRKRRVKFLASYLYQLDTSELSDIERAARAIRKALQQWPDFNSSR